MNDFNRNMLVTLFNADFRLVSVSFDESNDKYTKKLYAYKMSKREEAKVGDKLIVRVGSEYKLVTIQEIRENPKVEGSHTFDHKWIVGSINSMVKQYEANMEQDKKLHEAATLIESALLRTKITDSLRLTMREMPETEVAQLKELLGEANFKLISEPEKAIEAAAEPVAEA